MVKTQPVNLNIWGGCLLHGNRLEWAFLYTENAAIFGRKTHYAHCNSLHCNIKEIIRKLSDKIIEHDDIGVKIDPIELL